MTQSQSGIEQINLGFNDQEDRLLLRLGLLDKTEITVWITRRICKTMWNTLQATGLSLLPTSAILNTPVIVSTDDKNQAIKSFEREAAEQKVIENMDFKSEYLADRQTRTDEPMLAIQCVIISAGAVSSEHAQPPHLELQCKDGQSVKMALTKELVHAMTNMMQLATREAGWDLLMAADNSQVNLTATQQVLH